MSEPLEKKIYRQTTDLKDLLNDAKELVKQDYEVVLKQAPYFKAYQMTAEKVLNDPIYDESDALEDIAIAYGSPYLPDEFYDKVGRILEKSSKYKGVFTLQDSLEVSDNGREKIKKDG